MIQSIKESIVERVTSPLLGTFVSFWLIFNWKDLFFLLFDSNINLAERIMIYETTLFSYYKILVFPSFWTIVFLIAYPYLARFAFRHWRKGEQSKIEDSLEILKKSKVDGSVHVELMEKYNKIKVEHHMEVKNLKDEHDLLVKTFADEKEKLEAEILSSITERNQFENEVKSLKSELGESILITNRLEEEKHKLSAQIQNVIVDYDKERLDSKRQIQKLNEMEILGKKLKKEMDNKIRSSIDPTVIANIHDQAQRYKKLIENMGRDNSLSSKQQAEMKKYFEELNRSFIPISKSIEEATKKIKSSLNFDFPENEDPTLKALFEKDSQNK